MWWSRRQVIAAAPLALAACVNGYAPLNGADAGLRDGDVEVAAPTTDDEFTLVAALEQRLGQPGRHPRYRLGYTVNVSEDPVGLRPDEATRRFNVIGRIDWTLTEIASGSVSESGHFSSFTSYSATDSPVAGLGAQQDAHARLMDLLADQLALKLRAGLAEPAPAA